MSLTCDRKPVEVIVFKRGRRRGGLMRVTRYRVLADGSLEWVHPFNKTRHPETRTAAPGDWRKENP